MALLPTWGEAQLFRSRIYTGNDGLPRSEVRSLAQDAGGSLWALTPAGPAAYDGVSWHSRPARQGLHDRPLLALTTDGRGRLWTVTSDAPTVLYRMEDDRWRALEPAPPTAGTATALAANHDGKAAAFATSHGEVVVWREGWQSLGSKQGLPSGRIHALLWYQGELLIATASGLCLYDHKQVSCRGPLLSALPTEDRAVLALASSPDAQRPGGASLWLLGRDWLGRADHPHTRIELVPGEIPLRLGPGDTAQLAVNRHRDAVLGNGAGLALRDGDNGRWMRLNDRNGLVNPSLYTVLADREDIFWVGGLRGLSKLVDRRLATYRRSHGLLESEVTALVEPRPGQLVLGHWRGLSIMEDGQFRTLTLASEDSNLARVMDLAVADRNSVWVAMAGEGLLRVPMQGGRTRRWDQDRGLPGVVYAVCRDDRDGGLWIGTSLGLFRLDADEPGSRVRQVEGAPNAPVRRLVVGEDGALWVATGGAGVWRLHNGGWRAFTHPDPRVNQAFTLLVEGQRVIVGSEAGLYLASRGRLLGMNEGSLAVAGPVYLLLRDSEDWLWIGTDNGVTRWNGHEVERLTTVQGLAGQETNRAAALVDSSNVVWIGTDRGVSAFEPNRRRPRPAPPLVKILGLEASGRSLDPTRTVRLAAGDHTLAFELQALSFIDETRVQYRVRLQGLESVWNETVGLSKTTVRYRNLSPGQYRLEVSARSDRSQWSEPAISAPVTVSTPFWRSGWFVALCGMLVALGGLGLDRLGRARRRAVLVDPLTGLPNRADFVARLERRLSTGAPRCTILLLNLDRLQGLNARLGHDAGDEILREAGRRLAQEVRPPNLLAHIGGDEFAVLLMDATTEAAARAWAERLQHVLRAPFVLNLAEIRISAGVGLELHRGGYRRAEHLLRDATIAMHTSKKEGPGGLVVYDSTKHRRRLDSLRLEARLPAALEAGELELHYQPIIALGGGEVVALEALVRWRHPQRGLLAPQEFLHLAEATGFIHRLEAWSLDTACRQLRHWRQECPQLVGVKLHLNLSAHRFQERHLTQDIASALQREELDPGSLHLEITESAFMRRPEAAIKTLEQLADLGVGIFLDDFGKGYSSLAYLQRFPLHSLKIDRAFVHRADHHGRSAEILRTITKLGHNLGLSVVAEGVERASLLRVLREIGCEMAQGFYFSQPMPAAAIERLLATHPRWLDPPQA